MSETKYWIVAASKDHIKRGIKGGFIQANHGKEAPLKRMKKGDYQRLRKKILLSFHKK